MLLTSIIKSMCLHGLTGIPLNIEVDVSSGMPCWSIVGLPDTSIKESKERVRTAIKNCGIQIPSKKYIINLSPANIRKDGAIYDLPIAVGILMSIGILKREDYSKTLFIGELSLNANINKVNGVLPICIEAKKIGIKRIICPIENAMEGSLVEGLEVIGVKNLNEVISFFNGIISIKPTINTFFEKKENLYDIDFSNIKGQYFAKRALEICASGGHNCLLIGTPGTGKTMLSKCLQTILPDLSFDEAVEITKIQSVSGILNDSIAIQRPFREPHHTITRNGLIGGGNPPKVGEISLAHLGVLYLDEFLEFNRDILELLRIPIEERYVNISRVGRSILFPCNFILLASCNPCPCGYFGSKEKKCTCSESKRKNYISKLSGPLYDRFDMRINVSRIDYQDIKDDNTETSKSIKERANKARIIQRDRYKNENIYSNSELSNNQIEKFCILDKDANEILNRSFENLKFSTRSYYKIIKVARTIADLEQSNEILKSHVLEAMQYRSKEKDEL